jgi:SAM-dependent methyltransferase
LKDASAYNIQFLRGRPILIDTLSFEPYSGGPWVAYRQFCQHFYAPLLLWSATDPRLARLSQVFIDGVPLSLASKLLPRRSWLKPGALLHIHMHAAAEQTLSGGSGGSTGPALREAEKDTEPSRRPGPLGPGKINALLESLQSAVSAVRWTPKSEWSSYYSDQPSYAPEAFARKLDLVTGWLNRLQPATVWDLGANTGQFSKVAAKQGAQAVALDSDPACVETLYREARAEKLGTLLPLVADLTNPSPAIGWANVERQTLEQRGPADLILALAVIHHLAIGNNVPLSAVADYFARIGRRAIVEFVPKSDPMVQRMLASRADVFERYTAEEFERAFSARFTIEQRAVISTSDRLLYLMTAL